MKVVGVTGGIGSGKSTVCEIFKLLNVPVFDADREALNLYSNSRVRKKVTELLGKRVYDTRGSLRNRVVASIVFKNADKLKALNAIIHPEVQERFKDWKRKHSRSGYVIREAAIMIESGSLKDLDFLINVESPKLLRINRLKSKRKMSVLSINRRMKAQYSDLKRRRYADAIITNDERSSLIEQVLRLHKKLSKRK